MLVKFIFSIIFYLSTLNNMIYPYTIHINSTGGNLSKKLPVKEPALKDLTVHIPMSNTSKKFCFPSKAPEIDLSEFSECERIIKQPGYETHPDMYKQTPEILETYNYTYKEYEITTEDGYILTLYRILESPNINYTQPKVPIYVNHGLGMASDWWFFQPGTRNLAFKLSDAGYDVWLANSRGTSYSLKHKKLDSELNLDYWDFSFHELGLYDVPAVTDTIIEETGYKKIIYIGFSMGTTQMFVSLSELPEMNEKILTAFLMAPVAYIGHCTNGIRYLANVLDSYESLHPLNEASRGRLRSSEDIRKYLKIYNNEFCATSAAKCGLCDNALFAMHGYNEPQMNRSALPYILAKMPNSASVKTFSHYAQFVTSCRFQKYDYSPTKNMLLYGSTIPPEYKLENIRTPLHFYIGEQDNFSLEIDIDAIAKRLRHGVLQRYYQVKDRLFNHLDFAFAKDADKLVYDRVLKDMERFKNDMHKYYVT